jgi:hypothetical protein
MDEFIVNEDLSGYTPEEIADLLAAGNEALDALLAIEKPTREEANEALRISGEVDRLQEHVDSAAAETEQQDAALAALRERRAADAAAAEAAAAAEDEEEQAVEEPEAVVEEQPEAVAASGTRAPARTSPRIALAGRRPAQPAKPTRAPMQITAAADVAGFATGSQISDMAALANAVVARTRGFAQPAGQPGGLMQNYAVASFYKQFDKQAIIDKGMADDMDAISYAVDQKRLPGQSLTASGGWCSPSETLYDFCVSATAEGLVSLPEVQANRGGVKFTSGPDFATLYTSTGFQQTEAQAIAGTAKSCYEVVCPSFTEVRLDAIGLCIKVPILTNATYPELVQNTIAQSLLAHQHRVSAYAIGKMVTASGSAVVPAVVGGAAVNTLDGLELVAQGIRQDYRLPFDATIEGVAPFWLKGAIRADLANRSGVDFLAVSDATITGYLAERNIVLQWVYNWQALAANEEGYPTTAQVMLYPAGTFVKATTDVINLSAVYDAASLNVNTYTGLFMEEGIAVFKRCWTSKLVTLNVCASGQTGANSGTACFTLT